MTSETKVNAENAKKRSHERLYLALFILALICAVVGFALFFITRVPGDAVGKVNGTYITKTEVNDYITQYRISHNLTDDSALAAALNSQNLTVADFQNNATDQIAIAKLVEKRAEELGVTPTDDEVQEQIDEMKNQLAFGDDSTWQQTLSSYGMTEEQVKEQCRESLAQRAVCEKDVAHRDATDKETLSYAKSNMAGSEQKHYLRIVFKGDDKTKRSYACLEKLKAKASAGTLSAADFEDFVVKYSDEDNAKTSKGSYKWSAELDQSDDLTETLGELDKGEFTSVEGVDADSAEEIFFCDETYTFPKSGSIEKLKKADVPETLWSVLASDASDALWSSDCTKYMAKLLAQAQVTYYPVPEDASYNIDLSATDSQDSSSDSSTSSSSSN